MLFRPAFIILCFVFSVGKCQFFYNYEEADAADTPQDQLPPNQYNSPSAVNQQFQQETKPRANTQNENQGTNGFNSGNVDSIEESSSPRTQRPKKRLYRRVHREGTYVEPPKPPKTFAPSIFENIGLGQAPNGVYIPQDSFLNVLKNNRQSYNAPSVQYQNNVPSVYYQNNAPATSFFVQPPTSRSEAPAVQPNVQYASSSGDNSWGASLDNRNTGEEMAVRQNVQPTRPRRQRQQRPSNRPEPVVDIDVLRTPADLMMPITAAPVQGQRGTQGRSVSRNRQRQSLMIEDYSDAIQPPRTYSPSVFQNIGLGEAPRGVDIPSDSLLNVLRNPSSNSRSAPRVVAEDIAYSPQPQEDYSPPAVPEQIPTDSRRTRQRSRTSNASGRTVRRRTEYQYGDEAQDSVQSVPASSQQPRSQRTRNTDSGRSRGYASEDQDVRRRQYQYDDEAQDSVQSVPASSQQSRSQRTRNTASGRGRGYASEDQDVRRQQPKRTEPKQTQNTERQQPRYKPARLAIAALPEDSDDDGIPGEAGVDHPTLHTIPRTSFSCGEQLHNGYYADMETSCQVVHLCQAGGVKNSFLCPNGTIFSQEKFSCQWWYKVNCADSPKFYSINDNLYKVPEKKKQRGRE